METYTTCRLWFLCGVCSGRAGYIFACTLHNALASGKSEAQANEVKETEKAAKKTKQIKLNTAC